MKPLGISLKFWLVILLTLLGAELILFRVLPLSGKRELQNLSQQATSMDTKVATLQANLRRAQEQLENANLEKIRADYSKRQDLASGLQGHQLLEEISRLVKRLGIKYVAVQLEPEEDHKYYRKRSFSIKASSKFAEIVSFVDQLENNLHLTISNFSVQQGQDNPAWHDVGFTLSSLELKPKALSAFKKKASAKKAPSAQLITKISKHKKISKDPFFLLSKGNRLRLTKKRALTSRKPSLYLNGIMDLMGKKTAIINDEIVREGDLILKHRLISIGKDRVTLSYGKKKYTLNLKGLVTIKKGGLKKAP